jgi:hypothetical protein
LNGSGLHKAFDKALENGISFTDFQPYAPSAGDLAAFGGIAIKDKYDEDIAFLAVFNSDDQRFLSLTSMQSPRGMPNRRLLTGVQSLPQILI